MGGNFFNLRRCDPFRCTKFKGDQNPPGTGSRTRHQGPVCCNPIYSVFDEYYSSYKIAYVSFFHIVLLETPKVSRYDHIFPACLVIQHPVDPCFVGTFCLSKIITSEFVGGAKDIFGALFFTQNPVK